MQIHFIPLPIHFKLIQLASENLLRWDFLTFEKECDDFHFHIAWRRAVNSTYFQFPSFNHLGTAVFSAFASVVLARRTIHVPIIKPLFNESTYFFTWLIKISSTSHFTAVETVNRGHFERFCVLFRANFTLPKTKREANKTVTVKSKINKTSFARPPGALTFPARLVSGVRWRQEMSPIFLYYWP